MSFIKKSFERVARNPLPSFRAVFPAWKNAWESLLKGSDDTLSAGCGLVAGVVSPIFAAATEKAFNCLSWTKRDNTVGRAVTTIKTACTPVVASSACFVAVTATKTAIETTATLPAGVDIKILTGGAVIAAGGVALNLLWNPLDKGDFSAEQAQITSVASAAATTLKNGLNTMAQNGVHHYRTLFPANLTYLNATLMDGVSAPEAAVVSIAAGSASVKVARLTEDFLGNNYYMKKHVAEQNLRGAFLRSAKTVLPALTSSTSAIVVPAATFSISRTFGVSAPALIFSAVAAGAMGKRCCMSLYNCFRKTPPSVELE